MNNPLGINALRSSAQVFVRSCSKPCGGLSLLNNSPARCFSFLPNLQSPQLTPSFPPSPLTSFRKCRPVYQWRPSGLRTLKLLNTVIIHYVDLPPNYKDEEGLQFLRRDLDAKDVIAIFGPGMTTLAANKLLRILHGRRVAGTLDDPTVQINTRSFSRGEIKLALDYLRKNIPVDEIANAGLRAEDELAALEGEKVEEDAEEFKPGKRMPRLYKPFEKTEEAKKPTVYGESVFEKIRARNMARIEEEMRQKEEEERQKEEELAKLTPGELAKIDKAKTRQVSPRMQEYIKKATSDLEAPPEMKSWERILPSAVAVLLGIGFLVAYAEYYRPPKRAERLWPDIPPAAATVLGLAMLNLVVFAFWRTPPLWGFLNRYFLIVPATPKPFSLFGAMFSHQALFNHLLPNLTMLWFFGTALHDDVGRGNFLSTYLGTGALSALVSMSVYVLRGHLHVSMCGASGALYGIGAAYFWLHRFEDFRIFGLPPEPMNGVPGLAFLGLGVGINIIGLFRLSVHNIDVIAHLSGAAFGVLAGHFMEKKLKAKKELMQKKAQIEGAIPSPVPVDQGLVQKVAPEKTA
ncbi:hypothetical protein QBC37DRAFT_411301 [Rhypophila decipiens]|uniref:Peptidase S54 rhomboid domain-containing protein n=1 Tax=Rhypophila decipiens TaxID=261697 RepID=A0AAN6YJ46_9PEZI|nr:hypothetical protein QBC37DRAFT_411301 [Rhypophila decipiens]